MMAASTPETAVQNDYRARVAFHASRERVFDAIATVEGVRRWWMPIVKGCAATGGELRLEFEGPDEQIVLRIEEAERPSLIQWSCMAHTGLPEWSGTTMTFEIVKGTSNECQLNFRHVGLTPKLECYDHCRVGWDHFLRSLVAYVDRGKRMPFGTPEKG